MPAHAVADVTHETKVEIQKEETIQGLLDEVFGQDSIMNEVARCESQKRQFNENGELLRGTVNHQDVGVFQINEHYHLAEAQKLGIDIHTVHGNILYAKYLYDRNGLGDWKASKFCWNGDSQIAIDK